MLHPLGTGVDVAFEVDHADPRRHSGWSVVIHGRVWPVTSPAALGGDSAYELHAWAGGARDCWLRVAPDAISGRRVARQRTDPEVRRSAMPPG
jgi:hypothetical protein